MLNISQYLFDTSLWPPRWYCGIWSEGLGWTHIISDLAIFLAYFAIPVVLVYAKSRIKGFRLEAIFILFALFILFCGTIHLIEAIVFYKPIYRFAGLWKALTAIISWATVIALIPFVKRLTNLPKFEVINQELLTELNEERERLAITLEELSQKNKMLNEFSMRVAHDLKAPIRGIATYVQFLKEGDEEEKKKALERIGGLAQQSTNMIDEILTYSTSQFKTGEKSLINTQEMLRDVMKEIQNPDSNLEVKFSDALPNIYGNPVTIKEVFRNLIVNGIRHNLSKNKKIEIGYDADRFYVRDNGVGISQEDQKDLFETQGFSKKRTELSGTGFGMMIVKTTMDQHDGKVWVESEQGKGSTFYLSLPSEAVRTLN